MSTEPTLPDHPDTACPRCGSRHLMPDLHTYTESHGEKINVVAVPGAFLRLPHGISAIRATVCGDCGHTDFHATDYAQMWDAWREHNA